MLLLLTTWVQPHLRQRLNCLFAWGILSLASYTTGVLTIWVTSHSMFRDYLLPYGFCLKPSFPVSFCLFSHRSREAHNIRIYRRLIKLPCSGITCQTCCSGICPLAPLAPLHQHRYHPWSWPHGWESFPFLRVLASFFKFCVLLTSFSCIIFKGAVLVFTVTSLFTFQCWLIGQVSVAGENSNSFLQE